MNETDQHQSQNEPAEIERLLETNPNASAMYADQELHAGRLEWLAEHIRRCDFQIDPSVARTLLSLIDGSHPEHALRMVRSKKMNPKAKPRLQRDVEDFELALEVARNGGFERAKLARVCADVGAAAKPKIAGLTVQRRVRAWREFALTSLGMDEPTGTGNLTDDFSDPP